MSVSTPSPPAASQRPKFKIYPGWTMLGFSAAAQFMSGPGQSYSVAAFNNPMQETLGISATSISIAYGVATIISGLVLPWTGRQVDRFGARAVLPVVATLLAVACFVMASVSNLPSLYVGFTLIRCLGQGAMWLLGTWLVGEWFLRKRGFATALSGLGGSLSVMAFPLLNLYLIAHFGWQSAWQIIGLLVGATIVVPTLLFLRDRPEDMGLLPDGDDADSPAVEEKRYGGSVPTTDSWTLREVLLDATFWKLLSFGITAGMICTGMVFHQQSILATRGISKEVAMGLISLQAVIATLATLPAGWLTDRWRAELLLAGSMLLLALSILVVITMPHPGWGLVFAVLMGLVGSIFRSAGTVVWINFYGRANQGVIRGAAMSAMILAAAAGPIPLAMAQDMLGTYTPALIAYVIIPLLSMTLVLSAKQPSRPVRADH